MMRRFSRKRRGDRGKKSSEVIDAGRWLPKIEESGSVPVSKLEVISHDSVSDRIAVVGRGAGESGEAAIVAFSPTNAGDALLAALATGVRLAAEETFTGEVFAVAPNWSIEARRRLGLVRVELPFKLRPTRAPELAADRQNVQAEADLEPTAVHLDAVGRHLSDAEEREVFQRATMSLSGLAAKHGGVVRGVGRSVELVVYARRIAELRADEGAAALHIFSGQRQSTNLSKETLASAFDDLEGQIRRRLNDKKLRGSEEALRTNTVNPLVEASGLRAVSCWPIGGSDRDAIDVVGLGVDGRPVAGAGRKTLDLAALGAILDGVQKLRLGMPVVFADATAPVRFETPELALAAKEFEAGALQVLSALAVGHSLYEIQTARDHKVSLVAVGVEEAVRSMRDGPPRRRRQGGRSNRGGEEGKASPGEAASSDSAGGDTQADRGGSRRRGRRGSRSGDRSQNAEAKAKRPEERPAFEEVSLFDLDDSEAKEEASGPRRRGRQRQRGRRRGEGRRDGKQGKEGASSEGDRAEEGGSSAKPSLSLESPDESQELFADDLTEVLSEIPDDLPALQSSPEGDYAGDDIDEGGDDGDRDLQRERDKRRAVRKSDVADVPVSEEPPRPPRRRAVIVSAGDRDSLLSAVLLARDVRLLEGVWIYKQSELMNFFREVMPDIQEGVPIHLVGFVPSPAAEVLQAASLYRDRMTWYDHHSWPPEDLFALKQAIGEDAVHHAAGAGSTLPLVLSTSSRRSRFSDKMVDLACGRFTEHDYERWGRLWWSRLGEFSRKSGAIRSDIEPLLAGRPSDLAKEAARAEVPEAPAEVAYVAGRDFKLVHFGGYSLVIVNASEGIDLHLASRIARERYGAQLSLAYVETSNLFIFSGEETGGRRTLDFGALAEHLAEKLDWIQALPDDDHVARFRIDELDAHPDRLDEVIGEIAMGRSILER